MFRGLPSSCPNRGSLDCYSCHGLTNDPPHQHLWLGHPGDIGGCYSWLMGYRRKPYYPCLDLLWAPDYRQLFTRHLPINAQEKRTPVIMLA